MKKSLVALASLAVLSLSAHADDGLTGNMSLTNKYKYRGQDQSDVTTYTLPALQGGFDYVQGMFYVGNWNSSIGFGGGTEMDFYGGVRGSAGDIGYDVGVLKYFYAGKGAGLFNTVELYGSLSYSVLSIKYSHTVSDKYFGFAESSGTGYLDVSANFELMPKLMANLHYGSTMFSSDGKKIGGAKDYSDYKVGVTYDLGNAYSVSAAWIGANKDDFYGDFNKDRGILTIAKTF
jgi:uncharacterized protein (TIGR02001 family)